MNASAAGFTLTAIITWVLRDYSDDIFKHIRGLDNCLNLANSSNGGGIFDTGGCVGKGAVLRVSFGNFIFFGAPLHGVRDKRVRAERDQPKAPSVLSDTCTS